VGLSVVVPYVGAVVVTVPVTLIALFQWGWGDQFIYLMAVYAIIQALDGNVLVPLLFSEAVSLHPVAIICAVLLFGGLWGFWGMFFAIPLATLFKAVLDAWPRQEPASHQCFDALGAAKQPAASNLSLVQAWAASTASTCPGTFTPRHSWRSTPSLSIRKVLRSTPMYSLPYSFFSLITSNSWHSASSLSLISSKGSLLGLEVLVRLDAVARHAEHLGVGGLEGRVLVAESPGLRWCSLGCCPWGRSTSPPACP
jgi:hypothetical protein